MYLGHWSLRLPPFENVADSRFYFPTQQHDLALAVLSHAVRESREPALLLGPPGCGKTLLLRVLRRQWPREQLRVAFVPNVGYAQVGLLIRVAHQLAPGGDGAPRNRAVNPARAMDAVLRVVEEAEAARQTLVLMLDDWPARAPQRTLAELRWLLDLNSESSRVCALLAGERFDVRAWPRGLAQRISAQAELGPLAHDAVPAYLAHRIETAGGSGAEAFCDDAAALVAEWSAGVPRLINRAADLALHVAHVELMKQVDRPAAANAIARLANFSTHAAHGREDTPVEAVVDASEAIV